jgi:hypothetical protein
MWNGRSGVEQLVNPVPAVRPNNGKSVRVGVLLNDIANLSVTLSGFNYKKRKDETDAMKWMQFEGSMEKKKLRMAVTNRNGLLQTLPCDFH